MSFLQKALHLAALNQQHAQIAGTKYVSVLGASTGTRLYVQEDDVKPGAHWVLCIS